MPQMDRKQTLAPTACAHSHFYRVPHEAVTWSR